MLRYGGAFFMPEKLVGDRFLVKKCMNGLVLQNVSYMAKVRHKTPRVRRIAKSSYKKTPHKQGFDQ